MGEEEIRHLGRWRQAQKEETDYHEKRSAGEPDDVIKGFDLDFPLGRVLEVGCSPTSAIHYLDADFRVGLDPLALRFEYPEMNHVAGIGESLPFADESFDTVLCLNVLDHTINPGYVLSEIGRVAKPEAKILLSVNVFRLPLFLRRQLSNIDKEHPWHFSSAVVRILVSNHLKIISSKVHEIESKNAKTALAKVLGLRRMDLVCTN